MMLCRECNGMFGRQQMSQHLKSHGIEFIDYVKDNLDLYVDYHPCPICKINVTKGTTCSRPCYAAYKKLYHVGVNASRYGAKLSDEHKQKIGNANRGRFAGMNVWDRMNPDVVADAKRKISESAQLRVGKLHGMYGRRHSIETIKKIYTNRSFTDIENIMATVLTAHGIKYKHQFFINTGTNVYAYDFKICDTNILIECDGDYWHGNPNTTNHCRHVTEVMATDLIKTEIANDRGYELHRFWGSDIKGNTAIVEDFVRDNLI